MAKKTSTADAPSKNDGVTVEDIGPSRKKITITIPADRIAQQLAQSMDAMTVNAALPGFRAGRAPRRLIEKRFGQAVREEAKSQLISAAYSEAVQQHKLAVLGDPEGAEEVLKAELNESKPLTFSVEVEVAPEITLPDFAGIQVKKPTLSATDEMVTEQLDRIAVNEGALEPQEQATLGDYCIGHGVMKDESGEVVLDLPGAVVQIPPADKNGRGAILGIIVDDFGKQVGTPKPGDVKTIKAVGPENHERPAVRGKKVTIEYTIERVERIIPASIEDLVARSGASDEKQLRDNIMLRMNQRVLIEQLSAMRQQVAKHLIDTVEVPLPEKLTAKQAERTLARQRMELLYRGADQQEIEQHIAELRASSAAAAQRELKLFFILGKAAEQLGVRVTEEEVNGRIAQMAAERGLRADQLRSELIRQNQVGFVVQQIREHKAMDAILSKATVSEVSADDYNAFAEKNEGLSRVGPAEKK